MPQNKQTKGNMSSNMKSNPSGTDPQKVKKDIQTDVSNGIGDMTSREAGAMND